MHVSDDSDHAHGQLLILLVARVFNPCISIEEHGLQTRATKNIAHPAR